MLNNIYSSIKLASLPIVLDTYEILTSLSDFCQFVRFTGCTFLTLFDMYGIYISTLSKSFIFFTSARPVSGTLSGYSTSSANISEQMNYQ